MCSRSSGQVITPGVESGATKSGQVHLGKAPTSLHMSTHTPASLFCSCMRCLMSSVRQAFSVCAPWRKDACFVQAFSSPCPRSDKLSMCSSSSGHVITPGVESGATKSGQVHFGNAPTSLHMSTQTPASLFCNAARTLESSERQACSVTADFWSAEACLVQALISPCPHSDKLSMCSSNSGQVMTPGVESGATKSGHVHLGKAPTSLHMSTQTPASLFCTCTRWARSSPMQDFSLCAAWTKEACFVQAFNSPCPHSDKLSMCSSSSGQVMTPGVESGATKSGQVHLGNAPTSLHMSTQTPASLFCSCARCLKSSERQAFS